MIAFFLLLITPLFVDANPQIKYKPSVKAVYSSLDPNSISENLNFYKLYPNTELGKKAYSRALKLLSGGKPISQDIDLPKVDLSILVSMVQKKPLENPDKISEKTLDCIESLASRFKNRGLKGHEVWTKEELLALPSDEIDLARALFLAEYDYDLNKKKQIRYYEASIDLMALQIQARLPRRPTDEDKVRKINDFIFHEMQFRFPPHSLYAKNIDTYTFLPSVIDNRKGVCLGVSLLYQCIAQRLGLYLESITPPGHIYIRYRNGRKTINIETTARGIDIPTEKYYGIETIKLQQRTVKELVGLAFMNQASVYWGKQEFEKSVSLYEKALEFVEDDALLKELYGYNLFLVGRKDEGKQILDTIDPYDKQYLLSEKNILEDFIDGKTDTEGLKAVFMHVDETQESILKKQEKLKEAVDKFPAFRAGLLQLASSFLQLLEEKKALEVLNQYFAIYPDEAIVNYYLSIIHGQRMDYKRAWKHFHFLEKVLNNNHLYPKPIKYYKKALMQKSPLFSRLSKKQIREIAQVEKEDQQSLPSSNLPTKKCHCPNKKSKKHHHR